MKSGLLLNALKAQHTDLLAFPCSLMVQYNGMNTLQIVGELCFSKNPIFLIVNDEQ